jgi:predicted nucleic acid-binding protein
MSRLLLDTSVLISNWHRLSGGQIAGKTGSDARDWANDVVAFYNTSMVATPVIIEFSAGTRTGDELSLARAYLERFEAIDHGMILREDWDRARRIAERIPRDGKRRQLGDCLIRAIAERFNCDVITLDDRFP